MSDKTNYITLNARTPSGDLVEYTLTSGCPIYKALQKITLPCRFVGDGGTPVISEEGHAELTDVIEDCFVTGSNIEITKRGVNKFLLSPRNGHQRAGTQVSQVEFLRLLLAYNTAEEKPAALKPSST
jgi:hypothetical protein